MRPWIYRSVLLAGLVVSSAVSAATTEPRLAIGGYDTVAYFTDGKPVQGSPEFQSGTTQRGNSPAPPIAICSSAIPSTTPPSMTGIAPWACRMALVTRIPSIRRHGRS
jgi:hypothetical protein